MRDSVSELLNNPGKVISIISSMYNAALAREYHRFTSLGTQQNILDIGVLRPNRARDFGFSWFSNLCLKDR